MHNTIFYILLCQEQYQTTHITMKETINVNIGSRAFTMDRDAYARLGTYLRDIKRRLSDSDTETMDDIESRIAEIFSKEIQSPMMVVSIAMAERAISQIGRPEDFGPAKRPEEFSSDEGSSSQDDGPSLRRSRTDRVLGGVCGGLAKWCKVDASVIRIVTLLGILFGGLSIWIYIILWIVIPSEK